VLKVPPIAISVERQITYNKLSRRYDIVVFFQGECLLVVECKAPSVELSEETLQQVSIYNNNLRAKYVVLFNGKQELVYRKIDNQYVLQERLPVYKEMK
jgi:type I site-specific restriction-modification system R (restriction) subunit